jgi:hypothetical protein
MFKVPWVCYQLQVLLIVEQGCSKWFARFCRQHKALMQLPMPKTCISSGISKDYLHSVQDHRCTTAEQVRSQGPPLCQRRAEETIAGKGNNASCFQADK